ncbi:uncharacterized protein LOC114517300 isoform X2 [Dendronephthya gigantea]|uniref:uncharacterized protein LOC114517300 isoform X2 n=1 Tax=Dendronephthya gigantea TaxID=151771 RepID=UPI00106BAF7E|nr:uncharacterized protein LOC114517300 isoform X2 [Dendronephthya gigantea]
MSLTHAVMYIQRILTFFCSVVLSLQAKPDDCIRGKQYLSTTLVESGECVECPPNWKTCYDQPYEDQKRCADWCRRVPDKSSSTESTSPLSAETSTEVPKITGKFPKATLSPTATPLVGYPSVVPKGEVNEDEPDSNDITAKSSRAPAWLYIVVSVTSLCAITSVISLVLLLRARKRSKIRNRGEVGGDEREEEFPLHEIPPENDAEGQRLQPNDEEDQRLPANADEEQGLLQPDNGGEQNPRRQNHEELGLQPTERYLHWPNPDVEEYVARQETQPPVQCCTSSRPTSTISGQEEGNSSSLNIQAEVEN